MLRRETATNPPIIVVVVDELPSLATDSFNITNIFSPHGHSVGAASL